MEESALQFIELIDKNKKAFLAPMAGITDRAFREIAKEFGAGYVISEMVSSKAISYNDKKSMELMKLAENEKPCGVQIFGNDPGSMCKAAEFALRYNPSAIDINMGCPAPKVNKSGGGAVLMKDPQLCFEIVTAVRKAINIPLTVKIRKGWDSKSLNAVEVARVCEAAGADAITVHGRTREDTYSGKVDLKSIYEVKNAVDIPVIGNGDITCAQEASDMINKTGCDFVMVGRGAIGNPFIFDEINNFFANKLYFSPTLEKKVSVMLMHIKKMCEYKGEIIAMKEARRHICMYIKGVKNAAHFRNKACHISTWQELCDFSSEILTYNVGNTKHA